MHVYRKAIHSGRIIVQLDSKSNSSNSHRCVTVREDSIYNHPCAVQTFDVLKQDMNYRYLCNRQQLLQLPIRRAVNYNVILILSLNVYGRADVSTVRDVRRRRRPIVYLRILISTEK